MIHTTTRDGAARGAASVARRALTALALVAGFVAGALLARPDLVFAMIP